MTTGGVGTRIQRPGVSRGAVTLWLPREAIATWEPPRVGTRGGQANYSNPAIEPRIVRELRRTVSLPPLCGTVVVTVESTDRSSGLIDIVHTARISFDS